ncbi:hypothetical protein ANCDUO_15122 [Ancylostoma duodenale]|uniref:Glycosyltransferase family 92 protein n=1 Tax=Ancylostoma duodenale TaxID=51022 RepID=A0A0C2G1A7_9BILA|nr:hypothetical protein ANCDUO_15122 [Ancylostoma duodenale]
MPKNIALPEHISSCVPFYELLQKHVKANTGNRKARPTKLSLLASYAYSNYAVVTLEADGWYGMTESNYYRRTVYCRYFDRKWKELSPVESVVFPEFVIHCCRHPLAYYMSISERKDEETDFMVPVLDRIDDRKLVNDYVKGGEAEIVRFQREHDRPLRNWQHVAVQDCVQRSRQHSRYTIFADLDERIMPLKDSRLVDYGAETLLKHLPTLVFHKTTAVPPRGHSAKFILDTERVSKCFWLC